MTSCNVDLEQMAEQVDLLGIIDRAIAKMPRIPPWLRDEAKSQALLDVTRSMRSFKPEKGVPLAAYLARDIRFCILNWQQREYKRTHLEIGEWIPAPDRGFGKFALEEVIEIAQKCLSRGEYVALIGSAVGFTTSELERAICPSEMSLRKLQRSAREKLMGELRKREE